MMAGKRFANAGGVSGDGSTCSRNVGSEGPSSMRYDGHLRGGGKHKGNRVFKSRKGSFGFDIRKAKVRPSNTAFDDLLRDKRFTEAVLGYLADSRVGMVREGILHRD